MSRVPAKKKSEQNKHPYKSPADSWQLPPQSLPRRGTNSTRQRWQPTVTEQAPKPLTCTWCSLREILDFHELKPMEESALCEQVTISIRTTTKPATHIFSLDLAKEKPIPNTSCRGAPEPRPTSLPVMWTVEKVQRSPVINKMTTSEHLPLPQFTRNLTSPSIDNNTPKMLHKTRQDGRDQPRTSEAHAHPISAALSSSKWKSPGPGPLRWIPS